MSGLVRALHWIWGGSAGARLARLPLIPLAGLYWAVMQIRAVRRSERSAVRIALPAIAVGNLSVGGTGKTPLAAWIAEYCAAHGRRPAILLRGYGGDEPLVHRRLAPRAVVVANPDRVAGARAAQAQGAQICVLDDAYQLTGVARELNIAVVSAESAGGSPWPLPAGPWRERWDALSRADLIVVTRKSAAPGTAAAVAERLAGVRPRVPMCIAALELSHLEGMQSGARHGLDVLAGRAVVAAAGIADPSSFAAQLGACGAIVQLVAHQDHHVYTQTDVERLARAARAGDYVVVTEKDAVKLRARWPGTTPEPLVAVLAVRWERSGRALEQAVDAVLAVSRPAVPETSNSTRTP
ncbi:MAG TPA: tetraacyldisaccharide 4'-kinase [Gemmatimonadales bacterium]|nr:tetraacyldisaccharide 4'-kinase [Gemmatimonadales bacterium]